MRFGHRVQGIIEGYDDKGRGVFELRGTDGSTLGAGTAAIPFTAKGDEVTAIFTQRDHGTKICKLESIEKPSPDRVAAPCPHAGVCGGCLWQHLKYETQLDLKRDAINSAFEKAGHEERVVDVMGCRFQNVIPAPEPGSSTRVLARDDKNQPFHFRNRMDYAVGWNGEIGLKEYGTWSKYVDVKTCLLLNDGAGEILQHVRDWMKECDLLPWDAKFFTGDIRYVVIREGKNTKQRLIVVVVKDLHRISPTHYSLLATRLSPLCTSLLIGEQNLQTDISLAQKFETLLGQPWLEEVVNDIRYRIHPNSFFQTNSAMAGELQKYVASYLVPRTAYTADPSTRYAVRGTILDLYCGLGFFGIYLAKNLPDIRVHGFELDEPAIELAKFNAEKNGVAERCEFTAGKAEDLSWKDIPTDAVILDPPRSGLHPKVLKTILEMKPPTIVYVSCNYHRLVEELKQFKSIYRVESIKAFDLFPHTPHVEVVVKLVRI